jgi:hypothetical protein
MLPNIRIYQAALEGDELLRIGKEPPCCNH